MAERIQIDLPEGYAMYTGLPPVPEYLHIRVASGMTPKTAAQAEAAPKGTWYGCFVTYTTPTHSGAEMATETAVGMGRIISDGAWYFHIADMALLPEHQRKGLGDAILKHLLAHIKANCAEGDPYVTLIAARPGQRLYAKNGFLDPAPRLAAMQLPFGWQKDW